MRPEFIIHVNPATSLVRMKVSGFFTVEDVARLEVAQAAEYGKLRCEPGRHRTVIDIRDMAIQTAEVVQALTEIVCDPRFRSERLAFVVAKTLVRMQIGRIAAARGEAQFFTDEQAAWTWLRQGIVKAA